MKRLVHHDDILEHYLYGLAQEDQEYNTVIKRPQELVDVLEDGGFDLSTIDVRSAFDFYRDCLDEDVSTSKGTVRAASNINDEYNAVRSVPDTAEPEPNTDQDLITAINKVARTRRPVDFEIAKEIMFELFNEGDQVFVEYPDGNMYPFTVTRKSNYYNNFRVEFEAKLPREFAAETSGYVKTCNLIGEELIPAIQKGRRWYLNFN